jgi:hypothetical protein
MDAISVESNLNRADTSSITGVRHHHGQENVVIGDQNHRMHRLYEPLGWRYLLAEICSHQIFRTMAVIDRAGVKAVASQAGVHGLDALS